MQLVSDREAENARLAESLVDMRDAAIARDLELTSVRLAAGAGSAEAAAKDASQRSAVLNAGRDLETLRKQLEEETTKR
eukprot:359650-Chlamydomonas_euryale.AAC.9